MSTVRATNFQHASAAAPAIVLAADGSATANVSSINNGPLAGMRNAIINGNFDIWQRGTSFTDSGYGVDRWGHGRIGTTHTVTRQSFTLGQTAVPNEPTYFCRTAVTSVAGAGNTSQLWQRVEDVRTFAGQQVTVSFWAKVDATKNISIELIQYFGTGGSPSAEVTSIGVTKVSVGTSWQKVTVTTTLPSISGKTLGTDGDHHIALIIWFDAGSDYNARTDTLGQQSGTFDIAQVQVEPGPVATPFERRPIGMELSLCQRYFQSYASTTFRADGYASGDGVTVTGITFPFCVPMRAAPSQTGTYSTNTNINTGPFFAATAVGVNITGNAGSAGQTSMIMGVMTFSAEL
jgi:hypothetical protein